MLASNQLQRMNALRTSLAPELPILTGDRIQLQQVVLDLILNAAESMADVHSRRREITVSTAQEGPDRVRFSVKDLELAWTRLPPKSCSRPSSPPRRPGWASGLRSAGPSWRTTMGEFGPSPTMGRVQPSILDTDRASDAGIVRSAGGLLR